MSPCQVVVLGFDQVSHFHLTVPGIVFGPDMQDDGQYRLTLCSETTAIRTSDGLHVLFEHGLEATLQADVLIVPSWRDPAERPSDAICEAVRAAHARGAIVLGLCLGAYVLAAAGVLDGHAATTHWAYAADFARRYPQVRVLPEVLYVDEGRLLTSAGTVAGIDCCLHLLRRQVGAEIANRTARRLVMSPHRLGGQAQFIEHVLPETREEERLANLLQWMRAHLAVAHSLDSLAARALMSRRTLTRQFRRTTGHSPLQWLTQERLRQAQRLLEEGGQDVATIAQSCGFGSVESFRTQFRRRYGLSPMAWRAGFARRAPVV